MIKCPIYDGLLMTLNTGCASSTKLSWLVLFVVYVIIFFYVCMCIRFEVNQCLSSILGAKSQKENIILCFMCIRFTCLCYILGVKSE